ncbi:hypothetical protein GWO70_002870 [Corynebacterium macginleyi]|nr:hypothetical protein [Corynebacterium macginleyi]QRJ60513.1 hypothetical protein GWO70_002870 [Corynebacterium macginleyi]
MVVDYLSCQPNRAGYQVSTKQGSGPVIGLIVGPMVYLAEKVIEIGDDD